MKDDKQECYKKDCDIKKGIFQKNVEYWREERFVFVCVPKIFVWENAAI